MCFLVNKDPLSPDKLFFVNCGIYFASLFYDNENVKIHLIFIGICVAAFLGSCLAFRGAAVKNKYKKEECVKKQTFPFFPVTKIWVASIPALFCQYYLLNRFGSFGDYVKAVTLSEKEFAGLGILIWTIKSFSICNIIYFCFLCLKQKVFYFDKLLYFVHFSIMVFISLLSGSRGTLLVPLFILCFCYHYLKSKISLLKIVFMCFLLLLCALVLGVAREGYAVVDGKLTTGLNAKEFSEMFKTAAFYVGTEPLNLVLKQDGRLYWGATYLSALTNFVPRNIWPTKPITGGMVLTIDYTGDAWGGLSYLSTGIIPEAVINFGLAGIGVGLFFIFLINYFLGIKYNQIIKRNYFCDKQKITKIIIYAYICWGLCSLLVGDFANIITGTVMNIAIIICIIKFIHANLFFRGHQN